MTRKKHGGETEVERVSAARLAAILADPPFTSRWLRCLAERGYLVKIGRAEYDLRKSIQGYARYIRDTKVAAVMSRENFEAERTRKLKLKNDETEAGLIDTKLAIRSVNQIVDIYVSGAQSVPERVTKDPALRQRWEREISRIVDGINQRRRKAISLLAAGRDPLKDAGDDEEENN